MSIGLGVIFRNILLENDKIIRLCLVTVFIFYFQKLVFENIKMCGPILPWAPIA